MNIKNNVFFLSKLLIFLSISLLLTSCIGESDDVKNAKKELGINGYEKENIVETSSEDIVLDTNSDPRIKVNHISGDNVLEFDELKYDDFKSGSSKISGKTSGIIDKIIVDFSNKDSDFPNDSYKLDRFKKGDQTFVYNAKSNFKVLDFGTNKYVVTAYYGDFKSVYEVLILVSENDDKVLDKVDNVETLNEKIKEEEGFTKELIGTENNLVYTDLPKGGDFGNVVKLGENSFTYSDIKGLEVKKEQFSGIDCGKNEDTDSYFVTEFLNERNLGGYYWNTCRDIVKGKGISFFVARLDGYDYIYEKHYLDSSNGFYGVYEIEKDTLDLEEGSKFTEKLEKLNIKRKELKEKNSEYERLSVVDDLFRKISK